MHTHHDDLALIGPSPIPRLIREMTARLTELEPTAIEYERLVMVLDVIDDSRGAEVHDLR